jgi:hypothetical protein
VKRDDCPHCDDSTLVALITAIAADDIDRAMSLGLIDFAAPNALCVHCAARIDAIVVARDARLRALAARDRYRMRQTRLAERAEARARRRAAAMATTSIAAAPATVKTPALPPAAAAALARAKAKVAGRSSD